MTQQIQIPSADLAPSGQDPVPAAFAAWESAAAELWSTVTPVDRSQQNVQRLLLTGWATLEHLLLSAGDPKGPFASTSRARVPLPDLSRLMGPDNWPIVGWGTQEGKFAEWLEATLKYAQLYARQQGSAQSWTEAELRARWRDMDARNRHDQARIRIERFREGVHSFAGLETARKFAEAARLHLQGVLPV